MKKVTGALILIGLIILVVSLTIGEKVVEHKQQEAQEVASASARTDWEARLNRMFDARWRDLSSQTRAVLDSIASATLSAGVSAESLLVAMEALTSDTSVDKASSEAMPETPVAVAAEHPENTAEDPADDVVDAADVTDTIMMAYGSALDALPSDLSSYEKRIAVDEVRYLIRVRFNLSEAKLDSLLTSRDG